MSRCVSWAMTSLSTRLATVLARALSSCGARGLRRLSGYEEQRRL